MAATQSSLKHLVKPTIMTIVDDSELLRPWLAFDRLFVTVLRFRGIGSIAQQESPISIICKLGMFL